jgi:uncharacterized DUF497 family protein
MGKKPQIVYRDFELDAEKAKANNEEHEITFEEAASVFDDPLFIIFNDPDHSVGERRYIIIGESGQRRYLFVSFTDREPRTRIISARELDAKERRNYEKRKEKL